MKRALSLHGGRLSNTSPAELERLRKAGMAAAGSAHVLEGRARLAWLKSRPEELQDAISAAARESRERLQCLRDHVRLVRAAIKDVRDFLRRRREFPAAVDESGHENLRVCALTRDCLEALDDIFSEDGLALFLDGYQEVAELTLDEVKALQPALEMAVLERLAQAPAASWPVLMTSLRHISDTPWKEFFDAANVVDEVLERDPAGVYASMDSDSRESYRKVVARLAKRSACTEREVAEAAVAQAERAPLRENTPNSARRGHVGYYLIDAGLGELREAVEYRRSVVDRVRDTILAYPTAFYLPGVEIVTFLIVVGLLSGLSTLTPLLAGLILLILPATQAAVDFMNNLTASLLRPRTLPKLDFSKGVPRECTTIVAIPTLLLNDVQVRDLVLDLEIRFLANRDPNVYFALVTDSPDSNQPVDERDALVATCRELIEKLNHRYSTEGRSPFFLLHRHRAFNPSEGRWMGWERKRGKLLDLNRLLRGGFDSFPVKVGDTSVLPRVKYVITLDSDTQLPRDSAAKLIGTIAHPLNRAVVDPATNMVVEGYGILQPRIGISIQSASRSRMASIYSGQTGFDIYTHAISDVYQDLFGEGIFTGKGIYEVDALREVLEDRFPENALLSHDLIEGAYARVGLVTDIELIDDYPSHFSAYNRRKHRWVRGDWQIMRWLLARVPDRRGRMIQNPIPVISRWKILDNLRRSVLEPSMLLLLLAAWFYLPGRAWYWTAATVAVLFMPVYSGVFFSLLRAPWGKPGFRIWAKDTTETFVKGNIMAALSLVFLLHQALLSMDAIARSVARVFVTRRRLLEWETAAEAETEARPKATVDMYLEWTPWLTLLIALDILALHPAGLPAALPVLVLWFSARGISAWLNGARRTSSRLLSAEDTQLLRDSAERMCRYFRDWSSEATNWLIPDNVREDGAAALRLSPTNLGMLLNARIAAVHLGILPMSRFVFETKMTLARMAGLQRHRGHWLNWYDIPTMEPMDPQFVSTVDSGNLAASLWTLKQAALAFSTEAKWTHMLTPDCAEDLAEIAETAEAYVRDMDFRFLFQPRKKVMSIGYDVTHDRVEDASYDLLASEARIASFVAVAKGDIPQEGWMRLGREHTFAYGEHVLLSWTGTMFEYLMPTLWMRHHPGTITAHSAHGVVRVQREYARHKGVPWGISESAFLEADGEYGYAPFGVPDVAMKRPDAPRLVISPYSTFLALGVDPAAAMKNLRCLEDFGWTGRYGFYEAIDYTHAGGEVVRSWMAHHEGMSLLAACNLLFDNPMQRYFHAEPQVLATELLLHERIPSAIIEREDPEWLRLEQPSKA